LLQSTEVEILSVRRSLRFPAAWNDGESDRLWLYHLHYHEGLLDPATVDGIKRSFVRQWIDDNPPGHGVGWEPYPISIRSVNWIKWALTGAEIDADMTASLATQIRFLLPRVELHLMGNHLFVNAKALLAAGLFFSDEEAQNWLDRGRELLAEQVEEQFMDDGGHFELSPTYHASLTEDLLDVIQMCRLFAAEYPASWEAVVGRAVTWLAHLTHPNGAPALFNDAAHHIAPTLDDLRQYAARLGITTRQPTHAGLVYLGDSGYFRYETPDYCLIGDAGALGPDYIPGHGHCDMLSFELSVRGEPVICDTGVSTYRPGHRRQHERSTAAHNTVQVGNLEQSEVWAAFRVGRRARIVRCVNGPDSIEAAHDGYRLARTIHSRRFDFARERIVIRDYLEGAPSASLCAVARFHFAPGIDVSLEDELVRAGPVAMLFAGASRLRVLPYRQAVTFNVLRDAAVVEVTFDRRLVATVALCEYCS
jgi:uncharacterized heparinase superfamily protein